MISCINSKVELIVKSIIHIGFSTFLYKVRCTYSIYILYNNWPGHSKTCVCCALAMFVCHYDLACLCIWICAWWRISATALIVLANAILSHSTSYIFLHNFLQSLFCHQTKMSKSFDRPYKLTIKKFRPILPWF